MRAERLIQIVAYLRKVGGQASVATLAGQLGVSARTIHRDLDALSVLGVPVFCERGRTGGVRLDPQRLGHLPELSGLTAAEAEALALAVAPSVVSGTALAVPLRTALDKVASGIPKLRQATALFARDRLLFDAAPWFASDVPADGLELVQEAVWTQCELTFQYRRLDEVDARYRVQAHALVAKAERWYCVAATPSGWRVFRVDRMSDLTLIGQRFERDDGFDLGRFWAEFTNRFESNVPNSYPARLSLSPTAHAALVRDHGRWAARHIGWARPRRRREYSFDFETRQRALAVLAPLGRGARVAAPVALQRALRRLGEELAGS